MILYSRGYREERAGEPAGDRIVEPSARGSSRTSDGQDSSKAAKAPEGGVASLMPARTTTAGTGAPASFYCPISMELMADPVMVATGHTYDRYSTFPILNILCAIAFLPAIS